MTMELVGDDDVRHKKGEYYGVKCRLCGSGETRIQSNGDPIWLEDKNVKGSFTGNYVCYVCGHRRDKICHKCGTGQVLKSMRMIKYYDGNGLWTGEYICPSCNNKHNRSYRNRNVFLTIKDGGGSVMDVVVAAVLETQTCSIYAGDKKLPFCVIDDNYGIIGVKTSRLKDNKWYFNLNDYVTADAYFCIGLDEKLKNIDAVYVIVTEERVNSDGRLKEGRLSIAKGSNKYKKFEVDPEPYNHIYQNIDVGNNSK